jgi:hypothetical protein
MFYFFLQILTSIFSLRFIFKEICDAGGGGMVGGTHVGVGWKCDLFLYKSDENSNASSYFS